MGRRQLLIAAALLALPASALAQTGDATVSLTPAVAGKPSRLSLHASGEAVSSGEEAPRSVSLLIGRGFALDPRARARSCSAQQARSFSCPAASRVATGSAHGQVTTTLPLPGTFPFSATIEAFLTPRVRAGDIAGVVVQAQGAGRRTSIQGRLLRVTTPGAFGAELRFEDFDLGARQAPPGASAKLSSFDLSVAARRTVRKVRTVRRRIRTRRGTRIKRIRRVSVRRYYLIRNPRTCAGSWPYELHVTFPTRPEVVCAGSVACSGR